MERIYQRKENIPWQKFDDQVLVLDGVSAYAHELNETAGFIWDLLAKAMTKEQIIEEMASTFDVTTQEASKDVDDFLQSLCEKGLIQ